VFGHEPSRASGTFVDGHRVGQNVHVDRESGVVQNLSGDRPGKHAGIELVGPCVVEHW